MKTHITISVLVLLVLSVLSGYSLSLSNKRSQASADFVKSVDQRLATLERNQLATGRTVMSLNLKFSLPPVVMPVEAIEPPEKMSVCPICLGVGHHITISAPGNRQICAQGHQWVIK